MGKLMIFKKTDARPRVNPGATKQRPINGAFPGVPQTQSPIDGVSLSSPVASAQGGRAEGYLWAICKTDACPRVNPGATKQRPINGAFPGVSRTQSPIDGASLSSPAASAQGGRTRRNYKVDARPRVNPGATKQRPINGAFPGVPQTQSPIDGVSLSSPVASAQGGRAEGYLWAMYKTGARPRVNPGATKQRPINGASRDLPRTQSPIDGASLSSPAASAQGGRTEGYLWAMYKTGARPRVNPGATKQRPMNGASRDLPRTQSPIDGASLSSPVASAQGGRTRRNSWAIYKVDARPRANPGATKQRPINGASRDLPRTQSPIDGASLSSPVASAQGGRAGGYLWAMYKVDARPRVNPGATKQRPINGAFPDLPRTQSPIDGASLSSPAASAQGGRTRRNSWAMYKVDARPRVNPGATKQRPINGAFPDLPRTQSPIDGASLSSPAALAQGGRTEGYLWAMYKTGARPRVNPGATKQRPINGASRDLPRTQSPIDGASLSSPAASAQGGRTRRNSWAMYKVDARPRVNPGATKQRPINGAFPGVPQTQSPIDGASLSSPAALAQGGRWQTLLLLLALTLILSACGGDDPPAESNPEIAPTVVASDANAAEIEATPEPATDENSSPSAPIAEEAATAEPTALASLPTTGTIVLWHSWAAADGDALNEILARMQAKYPDLTVQTLFVAYDDLPQSYADAVLAGAGPDLIVGSNWWLSDLVAAEVVVPLDRVVDAALIAPQIEQSWPATVDSMRWQGALYGLPLNFELVSLYVNNALVAPDVAVSDAASMLAAAQADPALGIGQYNSLYHLYWGIPAFGGQLLAPDGVVVLEQNNGATDYLNWLIAMDQTPGTFIDVDYGALIDRFKKGEFAYFVDGPWSMGELRQALGDNLGVIRLPAGTAGPAQPWLSADGVMINPRISTEQQGLALTFAQELTSAESGAILAQIASRLPANRNANVGGDPLLQGFMQQAANAHAMPTIPEMNAVWGYGGDMFVKALNGVADPTETVLETATLINEANNK